MRKYFENVMEFLQLVVLLAVVASCNNDKHQVYVEKGIDNNLDSSSLSVDSRELYLGEIDKIQSESVSFTFNLKNISDSVLVINKVDVSCSCVEISDFPKQLQSGQSGKLTGRVDLINQSGHIRKSLFVNYCDTCIAVMKVVADITD